MRRRKRCAAANVKYSDPARAAVECGWQPHAASYQKKTNGRVKWVNPDNDMYTMLAGA